MNSAEILKSMADETRLSVIRQLAKNNQEVPCSSIVNDCARVLKLSQPTMSHHLSRLVQTGVLIERKAGTEKFYQLNDRLLYSIGINPRKL